MRIVCEQCQTKYIVPDDKIVKNVLRLTCQKCGHVITTRVEETDASERSTLGKWRETGINTPKRMTTEKAIWYYSYNGESFGPYTETELKTSLLSEKLSAVAQQCYVWNKNMTEWQPVMEVEPFCSALLMPPPPPAPAPAPKVKDDSLPPLFSESCDRNPAVTANRVSSPDVKSLKQRLQSAPKSADKPTLTMHSDHVLERLGQITSHRRQDDMPTHQAFPAVEIVNSQTVDNESDETKVGQSPLISFQSLDAISPAIREETKSGGVKPLPGKLPTISKLPVITPKPKPSQPITISQPAPSIGPKKDSFASAKQMPGISSLFGNAPAQKSAQTKSLGLPKFNGLKSLKPNDGAAGKQENAQGDDLLNASEVLSNADISDENAAVNNDMNPDDGEIELEGISLEMSELDDPSDLLSKDRNVSQEIPDIDLEDDQSTPGIHPNEPKSSSKLSLPSIVRDAPAQTSDAPTAVGSNILLDSIFSASSPNINVDIAGDASNDSLKVVSPSEMMGLASENDAETGTDTNDEIVLDHDINLDEDDSEISQSNETAGADDGTKSDLNSGDAAAKSGASARVSANKLEAIQEKHADLFAEVDRMEAEKKTDNPHISESSMLIEIQHFEKQSTKSRRNIALIIAIPLLIIAAIVIALVFGMGGNSNDRDSFGDSQSVGEFAEITGQTVTSDELDEALIPQDEFEIVAAEKPQANRDASAATAGNAQSSKSSRSKSSARAAANTADTDESDTQEDIKAPAAKTDGRANVVLKPQDAFASTDGVSGSKYQINPGGAPTANTFSAGLKSVSKTVQECYKREAKTGNMRNVQKIYIRFSVDPSGKVNSFEVEDKSIPQSFGKCLEGKKERWKFAPFEGDTVKMRQGFILDE